jgi:DNA-binding MarR family transcriptional regulator
MDATERPIGYWLKHLDRLIEADFGRALAEHDLSRRHWQVMNVLAEAARDRRGLAEALRPFWGEQAVTLDEVTGDLERRGWVAQGGDGRYALTPAGQDGHAAVAERVDAVRRRAADGLTREEYQMAVRVLARMADNLERAATAQAPGPAATGQASGPAATG